MSAAGYHPFVYADPVRCVVLCIGKSDFRKIDDSIDRPLYERMHARMQTVNREKIRRLRSSPVEPVLGNPGQLSCDAKSKYKRNKTGG